MRDCRGNGVSSGFWVCSSLVTVGRARKPGVRSSASTRGLRPGGEEAREAPAPALPGLRVGSNVKKTDKPALGYGGARPVPVSWFSEAGVLLSLRRAREVSGKICLQTGCVSIFAEVTEARAVTGLVQLQDHQAAKMEFQPHVVDWSPKPHASHCAK